MSMPYSWYNGNWLGWERQHRGCRPACNINLGDRCPLCCALKPEPTNLTEAALTFHHCCSTWMQQSRSSSTWFAEGKLLRLAGVRGGLDQTTSNIIYISDLLRSVLLLLGLQWLHCHLVFLKAKNSHGTLLYAWYSKPNATWQSW